MGLDQVAGGVLYWGQVLILVYFVLVNSWYALLLGSATIAMRRHVLRITGESRWRVLGSPLTPSISVLTPAYNEANIILDSLAALLGLHYPNLEIVVVNDGSTDETLEVLRERFELVAVSPIYRRVIETEPVRAIYRSRLNPWLIVVDKENGGGKAGSLNAALNLASGDLVCAIDADTIIEQDALQRMVRPFLMRDDVVAVGGTIRIANGSQIEAGRVTEARAPRQAFAALQAVEYLRAFLFGRLGWNALGGNLIVSGAFGLFRRDQMLAAGGYQSDTVGEDIEMVVRLRRNAYEHRGLGRVEFIPDPVAWTEAPEALAVLARQRDRWHRGLADVLWRHRVILFNPRYRELGFVVFPYYLFAELLAPIVEAVGLIGMTIAALLGIIDFQFAILFFLLAYGYGLILSVLTLVLEEITFLRYRRFGDRLRLLLWILAENFGYRQLTVLWRLRGLLNYLRGRKAWGTMERHGFAATPPNDLQPSG